MDENHNHEETVLFKVNPEDEENKARAILLKVYQALKEKGYNPLNQLVGYLISGDPAYITSHRNARSLIRQVERDELIEELVDSYLKQAEADRS
ncbi:MAG TPA: IreB family regulatory phosphoprotein [Bacillota bacterium]|nr:IreB family regulatory phosphoprotein [Bacillota bacterium]HOP68706.1 IreB family regulatory phosphoprotein [Bacillota bacterium]HPT33764.1 IreB family regulatory phosphoprotein [Bacillota bacterium]HPZ64402.1 IreB family regulatory phosphoprotein [Bacillota bacterium]HQD06762.1 IreB family regulatory phosphoprotein [Bacillota bacterium]